MGDPCGYRSSRDPWPPQKQTRWVEDFKSEPEKNEAFSVFWRFSDENLDEARHLGVHIIGPDTSPEKVRAVRRRLLGRITSLRHQSLAPIVSPTTPWDSLPDC
jgi:hypothetical protein